MILIICKIILSQEWKPRNDINSKLPLGMQLYEMYTIQSIFNTKLDAFRL